MSLVPNIIIIVLVSLFIIVFVAKMCSGDLKDRDSNEIFLFYLDIYCLTCVEQHHAATYIFIALEKFVPRRLFSMVNVSR